MINKKRLLSIILCLSMLFCSIFTFSACKDDTDEPNVPPVSNFTISFVVDGETYATITTTGNEKITLPSDPQKEGYTFDGWYWDNGSWNQPLTVDSLLNTPISSNKSVYAKFTSNAEKDISLYFVVDGVTYATVETTGNESVTLPANPQKDGYTFDGWYFDKDVWSKAFTSQTLVSSPITTNTTLYAKFTQNAVVNTYTLYFIVDGVTYTTLETPGNEAITLPTAPEKSGYTFDGWFFDKDVWSQQLTANSLVSAPITQNTSVYAKFTQNTIPDDPDPVTEYTLTFVVDGTTYHTLTIAGNATIVLPTAPEKSGYTFDGWFFDKDVWSQQLSANSLVSAPITQNTSVYAKFTENVIPDDPDPEYTITFIVDGVTYHSISTAGNEIIVIPTDPQKDGYTFEGWYFDKDVWSQPLTANSLVSAPLSQNLSVYAKFSENEAPKYTISFVVDGTTYHSILTAGNENITLPANPQKDGFTFDGWYWDKDVWSSELTATSLSNVAITSNKTVYAKFTEIIPEVQKYNVYFVVDGATYHTINTSGNEAIILPQNPTKDGHTFNGWFWDKDVWTYSFDGNSLLNLQLTADLQVYAYFIPNNRIDGSLGLEYTFDEESDGYIVKGIGSCVDTEIIIPTTYNSKPVIGIAESAFAGCFRVTKITIQNSVKFIDDDAFYNCINLNSLVLPDGIDTLGTDILFNTPLFNNSVYWEDGVLYIGNYLVSAKASLAGDYTVKEGTVAILDYAFSNCSLLKNVFIPNSVTYLGKYAFNNCINLGQVTLPSNITAINAYTFSGCEQLKSINIPNGILSIGNYAFSNCSALTNVTIPDSVQEIHKYAFNNCANINYEIVDGNLKYIGNWLFGVVDDTLTSANLKETTIGIFYEAFEYCDELTSIVIPNSVKSIGDYTFYSCDSLATVTLSNNLLYIGEYAFDSCESLTSITLPKSLISIGNDAFDACDSLTAVYYTGSIADWCNILFDYNDANPLRNNADLYINGTKVVELTIPNGITKINDYAFAGCTSITSIILPNSVTAIGENAFSYCYNLTEVIMSNNLVEIGEYAFYQCKALMSITIPQSVETIGYDAFYYCEKLIAVRNYSDLDIVAGDSDYGYVGYYADTIFTTADIDKEIFFTSGDFVFYKNGDNEYFLVGYNGTSATVVLPDTINGEAYSIFSYAFSGASHVTSITVPKTVKSIQKGAFYGCESLESITLPFIGETAKTLDETYQYPLGYIFGTSSFNNSVSARQYYRGSSATSTTNTTYYLPASLKTVIITGDTINYGAFYNCTNLETINIANAINIDGSIFYGCSKLTSVAFSNSLEKITASMFDSCTSLETITIPNSVTEIGNWAFDSCSALKSITIPSNVVSIGDSAFYNCGALESVTILGNLDKIGSSAFYNCEKLSSISLPSTITQIGQNAFYNTAYYNTADNWVDNVLYIGSYLISAKTDLVVGEYSIKAGTTVIASYAFYNCSGITKITIPTSVTTIGNYAFYGCNQMASINLDSNIKSIGSYAFYGCSALTEIAIPSSVTAIAERTFYNCTGLTSITIPSSITTIGNYAFYNCSALTTINYNAANCADLSSYNYVFYKAGQSGDGVTVNIGTTVNHIPSYLFYPGSSSYAPKIIALNFVETSSCKTIGKYAFGYCTAVESITFPASLESIAEYAFYNCTGLTSVEYLGTGVTVDSNAFSGCNIETADTTEQYENGIYSGTTLIGVVDKTVTTLVIRDGTTAIADNALSGYTSLTGITIPNSITAIGYRAFYNCKGLTSITLPKSVTEIESNAFENCSALTGVYYEGTLTEWCNISFGGIKANPLYYGKKLYINNTEVTSLVIPNDVTTISSYAFVNCTSITSIVVPNTVTTIGLGAFSGCSSLQSITLPFIGGSLKELTDTYQYPFGYIFGTTSYTGGYYAYQTHRGSSATGTTGSTYYIPSSLTTVVITGGQVVAGAFDDCKNLTSITLPNTATMIDIYAFSGCTGLTDILIPESITKIADDAFYSCNNLKNVHITSLEKWCAIEFYTYRYSSSIDCSNPLRNGGNLYVNGVLVTDLVIPSTVDSIAEGAFYGCTSITSVTIPSSVTEIGMLAFTNCTNMQTVTINDGITELPVSVFQGCSGLKTVNLPASITKINDYAFSGCSALSKVNYTGTISDWCNIKFTSTTSNPLTNAKKLYLNDSLASEIVIPEGVTTINSYAFKGCTSITNVTIPNSVKTIEADAFADCNGIRTVVFGSGIQTIGSNAFNGCSSLSKVYYIGSVDSWINIEIGTNASPLQYNAALYINGELIENVLVIPEGTTEIPAYAFAGNKYITKVIIPSSVTTIGEGAFKNCINLSEIELPDQTKYIYADAFYNTAYYNNIANWIDGNVLYIGNALIKVKTSTTGVLTIREGTYWIATGALKDCSQITELYIPESVRYYPSGMLGKYSSLTKLTLPYISSSLGSMFGTTSYTGSTKVQSSYYSTYHYIPTALTNVTILGGAISNNAFYNCTMLKSIALGDDVYSIGSSSFEGCTGITSITIPSNVYYIGSYAFEGCNNLKNTYYAGTLEKWCNISFSSSYSNPLCNGGNLYINNKLVQELVIPDTLTEVKAYTFYNCSSITSIVFPITLKTIGNYAFYGCTGLTELTIPNNVTTVSDYAFAGCDNIVKATMPAIAIKSIPKANLQTLVISQGELANGSLTGCSNLENLTLYSLSEAIGKLFGQSSYEASYPVQQYSYDTSKARYYKYAYIMPYRLRNVTVCNGEIPYGAFENCKYIAQIVLPTNLTTIGERAFYNCYDIESITLPSTLTTIGTSAFCGCEALKEISIPFGVERLEEYTFKDCDALEKVILPNSLVYIGANCFEACAIKEISIPNSVTNLSIWCFVYCTKLETVYLGSGIQRLGTGLFENCPSLKSIYYSGSIANWCSIDREYDTFRYLGASTFAPIENYTYDLDFYIDGQLLVDVIIPNGVEAISDYCFYGFNDIESVVISDTVTTIGVGAFSYCSNLKSLIIGKNVTELTSSMFNYTSCLESISVSSDNPNYASQNGILYSKDKSEFILIPSKLSGDIVIPEGILVIPESAFSGKNITSVILPDSVTTVEAKAFSGCSKLNKLVIGKGLTSIGENAFAYSTNPNTIEISADNESYSVQNGCLIDTVNCKLILGSNEGIIPEGVKIVGSYSFYYRDKLTTITIPSSVETIEDYAFTGCSRLKNIYNYSTLVIEKQTSSLGHVAFYASNVFTDNTTTIYEKDGFVFEYIDNTYKLIMYTGTNTNVILPNDYNGQNYIVGSRAFNSCDFIETITIPANITSFENYAFGNCTNLQKVYYLGTIGNWLRLEFNSTTSNPMYYANELYIEGVLLKDLVIPSSVDAISKYSLINLSNNLLSIQVEEGNATYQAINNCLMENNSIILGCKNSILPTSATSIGDYAFYNCLGLTDLQITSSILSIGNYAFSGCTELTNLSFEEGVQSIGNYAFKDCILIKELVLPNSLIHIGSGVLSGWSSLENITIPFIGAEATVSEDAVQYSFGHLFGSSPYDGGIQVMQWYHQLSEYSRTGGTFYVPASLRKVTVLGGTLPQSAFENCSMLTEVNLHSGMTIIPNYCFKNCHNLQEYVIGTNVTKIGEYAFADCKQVTSFVVPNSVTFIGYGAFWGCDNLTSISIPFVGETATANENSYLAFIFGHIQPRYADGWCIPQRLRTVTVTGGSTLVEWAFEGLDGIRTINLPTSLKTIYNYAFYGCSGLTEIYIPNSVVTMTDLFANSDDTNYAMGIFSYCSNLGAYYLGSSSYKSGWEWGSLSNPNFFVQPESYYSDEWTTIDGNRVAAE